jgi:hypothetical protein
MEDQGIPFCLGHHLSAMGDPTSSLAAASIALRIIGPHKPHHYVKIGIPWGGGDCHCNRDFDWKFVKTVDFLTGAKWRMQQLC